MRSGLTRMVDTGRSDRSRPGAGRGRRQPLPAQTSSGREHSFRHGARLGVGRGSAIPSPGGIVLATVALLFAAAVTSPGPASADEKLRIATTGDHPPFSRVDDSGEVSGLDIEIALALCTEIRAECEFVLYEWPRLIPELRLGNADAIAASMSITEKRRALVAFTAPYYANTVAFVAHRNSKFDPAVLAGWKIGAMRATVSADWLSKSAAGAVVRLYRDQKDLRLALDMGVVDAMLGDSLGFYNWLGTLAGRRFQYVGDGLQLDEGIGMAVRREDKELLSRLNRALTRIFANGTHDRITRRYFPFSIRPE